MLNPKITIQSLDMYLALGGMKGLECAGQMDPAEIIAEVDQSGLRGRGGAGFPTGRKWAAVNQDPCPNRFVVCNGAEGEPGTFKDRLLMRNNPYRVLEGMAIAARAVQAKFAFIAIKKSFVPEGQALERALKEMTAAELLDGVTIQIVRGPEDYLFGEEKALLEVIEGRDPLPRVAERPPYQYGLFVKNESETNPTVVNNVETFSHVPIILAEGAEAFRELGTAGCPGTMVFTVCGDVARPGVFELPMGTTLRELLETHAGGRRNGREIKAVFPGAANAVILPSMLDLPLDFDVMKNASTGLGAGGFIVCDESACMVQMALVFSNFLYRSSCTQCISCTYGTGQATDALRQLASGIGTQNDIQEAFSGAKMAPNANRCYLPVQHSILIPSILHAFADEVRAHFQHGCIDCRKAVLPLIADYLPEYQLFRYREMQTSTFSEAHHFASTTGHPGDV
ncbi:MAG TPA: NADH-ubiquinone oxidoreductase-F iron-sulfur binding region domain-containing protein [Planctomycetota bacterium]|jgi:NADH:ubiquinone oxidoreductase subunit F (NADH-binding)|nr:NADH-ubiquinone oxidoreductase-F iron-sulfur binding region domain-containing protein [Planctomycetota bacterium]